MQPNAVELALLAVGCNQAELARRLGVERAQITAWKKSGHVPPRQVKALSELSGVPAHVLCPEYFPNPNKAPK